MTGRVAAAFWTARLCELPSPSRLRRPRAAWAARTEPDAARAPPDVLPAAATAASAVVAGPPSLATTAGPSVVPGPGCTAPPDRPPPARPEPPADPLPVPAATIAYGAASAPDIAALRPSSLLSCNALASRQPSTTSAMTQAAAGPKNR